MLVGEYIHWWYGPGYLWLLRGIGGRLHRLALSFSVPILIRTLFAPWKRIISYGGTGLQAQLRAAVDNAVSRLVGFMVRVVVLVVAALLMAVTALIGLILLILWPLAPGIALFLIVRGFLRW